MRHLQPSPLEPTLDIEPLIRFRAIQNSLPTKLAYRLPFYPYSLSSQ